MFLRVLISMGWEGKERKCDQVSTTGQMNGGVAQGGEAHGGTINKTLPACQAP